MGLVEVLEDDGDVHVDDDHEVDDDEGHEVDHGHEGVPAVPVRQPLVVSRVMIHSTLEIELGEYLVVRVAPGRRHQQRLQHVVPARGRHQPE